MDNMAATMQQQGTLFKMPPVRQFNLTRRQQELLDWVVFRGNVSPPPLFRPGPLRRLIAAGLVEWLPNAPPPRRYRLTELGRLVRTNRYKGIDKCDE
jgi:hypothetical protein